MLARRHTTVGIDRTHQWLDQLAAVREGEVPAELLTGPELTEPAIAGLEVETKVFASRYEWAQYIDGRLSTYNAYDVERDTGLWSWLTLFYFDLVCPKDGNGQRSVGQRARYIPSGRDYRTYYRHLLESPWSIMRAHRENPTRALAALTGPLYRPGEMAEQLASRQELVSSATVMKLATLLYVDRTTGRPRRGAGGSGRGSPRRLAEVLQQFDVTYDIYGMEPEHLLKMMPTEFDRFRPESGQETQ